MKKIITITFGVLMTGLPLYAQNTSNTSPYSGDPSFENNSTMQEGSGTVDSFERGTSTSPGSGATTTIDDAQEMEDNRDRANQDRTMDSAPQDNTDIGTGAGTGTEVQDDQMKTPDDWEEEE